jgi:hypothetical protein
VEALRFGSWEIDANCDLLVCSALTEREALSEDFPIEVR